MGVVISVFGVKGGIGQSLVFLNLGVSISKLTNSSVSLLSLNEQELNSFIEISDKKGNINDILPVIEMIEPSLLKGYLLHHKSGIDILQSSDGLNSNQIEKIISSLKESYDYIIVSPQKIFNENLLAVFDNTQLILTITSPTLISFNSLKIFFKKIESFLYPHSLIKIVSNNITPSSNTENIKLLLEETGHQIFSTLPYEPKLTESDDNFEPFVLSNSRSNFSKAIFQLAETLTQNKDIYFFGKVQREKKPQPHIAQKQKTVEKNSHQEIQKLKTKLHKKLLEQLDLKNPENQSAEVVKNTLESLLAKEETQEILPTRDEKTIFINEMLDEVLGLGPLEPFLRDESISEIMTIGKDKIYIERGGKITLTDAKFVNTQQALTIIERILSPIGRRVDESMPLCDARLKDGSRVNIVIPPVALEGPTITIRKFMQKKLTVEDLISFGTLTREIGEFLKLCVLIKKNIIISGGTGSGKTTLLNILSSFIPNDERIVTIEDAAELKLNQEHICRLEARPPNIEGKGEVSIRRLVINALRMRPDRIIVGECRGGEALDMLQAMNTGHDGSLTTIHANSPREALSRLETMVLMAGMELPVKAIREQLKGAIDLIIQISRFSDGSRKITHITEVTGMEGEIITIQDIFRYRQTGVDKLGKVLGVFEPTGIMPTFVEEIRVKGFDLKSAGF